LGIKIPEADAFRQMDKLTEPGGNLIDTVEVFKNRTARRHGTVKP
jgi:aryl-alcohol dehydrogenase-like predicted oxidoreductase